MNILMSSFNCSSFKGSENSLGWNYYYSKEVLEQDIYFAINWIK